MTLYNKVLQDYTGTPVRSKLNIHEENGDFTLSHCHIHSGTNGKQRSTNMETVPEKDCRVHLPVLRSSNAKAIAETLWAFSDMERLRIYNAALKRGGMLHQNYYLSVGSMMVMIDKNSDAQATSNGQWLRPMEKRPDVGHRGNYC